MSLNCIISFLFCKLKAAVHYAAL